MPIKNYTSEVSAGSSLSEIQKALAKAGARRIMVEYGDDGNPAGVVFSIKDGPGGVETAFRLNANVESVRRVLVEQKVRSSEEQAQRTAWRILRDWVLAQCAIIESGMVETAEVFMPYITDGKTTMYQLYKAGQLALPQKAGGGA